MDARLYRICVDEHRLVAAEIDCRQAAEALDQGRPLLLGSAAELNTLARRLQKALIVIAAAARRAGTVLPLAVA